MDVQRLSERATMVGVWPAAVVMRRSVFPVAFFALQIMATRSGVPLPTGTILASEP